MYRFVLLSALISHCTCAPRTARIYNVLISSKKNLAPSQALPVYEPVLRTTSVGLAFSPFIYTQFPVQDTSPEYLQQSYPVNLNPDLQRYANTDLQNQPNRQTNGFIHGEPVKTPNYYQREANADQIQNQPLDYSETAANVKSLPNNVIPLQQYVPNYSSQLTYQQYYPREDSQDEPGAQPVKYEKVNDSVDDPKQIVANFKRNPEIPDVPPPPLPVKTS